MPVYELDATVTLSIAGDSGDTVTLHVTAPDGTETDPTPTFSTPNWSANVTADQYDIWLYAWSIDGAIVENGSFTVGGPWYSTLALLKKAVNRGTSDTSADDLLAQALEAGARSIEQYCDGRVFYLADTATARTFPTRRRLCLAEGYRLPTDDIGHATITAEVGDGTTWTELTDIETYPHNALARDVAITALISQTDWASHRLARITARWGWPSQPSAVGQANLLQSSRLYRRKDSPEGVAGSSEWGLVRVPNLDPDVKALLAPYVNQFRVA
ncbi:MAG TPA: hypothetical protein VFY84_09475 [Jiangellales bacterium]|nr:hypothetical protein [Jiangellales bacterium]